MSHWATKNYSIGPLLAIVAIAFAGYLAWKALLAPDTRTPEQIQEKVQVEAERELVYQVARALKQTMKNPGAFKVVSAILMPNDTVCIKYRGTNSFGAVVTEHQAISPARGFVPWTPECDGYGRNYTMMAEGA